MTNTKILSFFVFIFFDQFSRKVLNLSVPACKKVYMIGLPIRISKGFFQNIFIWKLKNIKTDLIGSDIFFFVLESFLMSELLLKFCLLEFPLRSDFLTLRKRRSKAVPLNVFYLKFCNQAIYWLIFWPILNQISCPIDLSLNKIKEPLHY